MATLQNKPAVKPAKTPDQIAKEKEAKASKFKELASARVNKAVGAIANVGKLANPRAYVFDASQCSKIETALKGELDAALKRFASALSGGTPSGGGGFSL